MENQVPEVVLPPQKPKSNLTLWVVVGIAILVVGIGVGLVVGKYSSKTQISSLTASSSASPTCLCPDKTVCPKNDVGLCPEKLPAHLDSTANWKTYSNSEFGFSFKYPSKSRLWSSEAATRIQVSLGENNIICGYPFQFTVIYSGYDLQKHNQTNTTYQTKIGQRVVNRYDQSNALEGCSRQQFSDIYIPSTTKPEINDFVIGVNYTDTAQDKVLLDQILSTFRFLDK